MKNSDMSLRSLRIVCLVRPRINSASCGMAMRIESLYYSFPNGHPIVCLFDGHTGYVRSFATVQMSDNGFQFLKIFRHYEFSASILMRTRICA